MELAQILNRDSELQGIIDNKAEREAYIDRLVTSFMKKCTVSETKIELPKSKSILASVIPILKSYFCINILESDYKTNIVIDRQPFGYFQAAPEKDRYLCKVLILIWYLASIKLIKNNWTPETIRSGLMIDNSSNDKNIGFMKRVFSDDKVSQAQNDYKISLEDYLGSEAKIREMLSNEYLSGKYKINQKQMGELHWLLY